MDEPQLRCDAGTSGISQRTAESELQGYRVPSPPPACLQPLPPPGTGLCTLPPHPHPPAGLSQVMELPVSTCFITKLLTEESPHNDDAAAPPLTSDPRQTPSRPDTITRRRPVGVAVFNVPLSLRLVDKGRLVRGDKGGRCGRGAVVTGNL